jgi:DNA invertase Pin-like site-specific DNA recombinase
MGSGKRLRSKDEIHNVVIYCRVSDPSQVEKDLSLPAQRKHLHQWAASRGYTVLRDYIEPGLSARDDKRPEFMRMLGELLDGQVDADAILVVHTSRFMRNSEASFVYRKKLEKKGIRVLSASQETDDSPSGKLMEAIFAAFDQYESDMNAYRTMAAMRENAIQGFFNGSKAPFGFQVTKKSNGKAQKCVLVPNPDEVDIVREVFQIFVNGKGAKGVAAELNRRGVRYRKGKPWTKDFVLRVIDEEAAVGTYRWGKRDTQNNEPRDPSEWIPIPVDPIIDRDLFDVAQEMRKQRDKNRAPGRTASSPLLLSGLLRCGRCGAAFALETSGKVNFEGVYDHRYYNCRSYLRTGQDSCPGHRIPTRVLDRIVLDHLADTLFNTERCKLIISELTADAGALKRKADRQRESLRTQVRGIEPLVARWQTAFESGEALDVVAPRLRELQAKRAELEDQLSKLTDPSPPPAHALSEAAIKRFQDRIKDIFISNDTPMTKAYLQFLIDRIVVHDDKIEIRAKAGNAVALIAADPSKAPEVNRPEAVLANGGNWLPTSSPNQNRPPTVYLCLPQHMLEGKTKPLGAPPIRKMLERAEEIKRQLDDAGSNRAGVARKLHLTRPRVTQLMKLLDLHPLIREYIKSLPPGTPDRMVTERALRGLVNKSIDKQLDLAAGTIKGFKAFMDDRRPRPVLRAVHNTDGAENNAGLRLARMRSRS